MDLESAHAYVLQVFVPGDPFDKRSCVEQKDKNHRDCDRT